MNVDVDAGIKSKARTPHNLFMLNLALFHLLMTPASIALDIGLSGMLLPLLLSLAVMLYTWMRSRERANHDHWFIYVHWKLAVKRSRLLLIGYLLTAGLLLIGWLLTMGASDPNMQEIMQTVFIRIAIMPVLLMVMVNFYLESSAINQATNGEIPDHMAEQYPQTET